MDALFNQHFSIGSNYPSSLNRSSLRAPSPPPPQPVNLQSKASHEFPETGGNFTILLEAYIIPTQQHYWKSHQLSCHEILFILQSLIEYYSFAYLKASPSSVL